MTHLRQRMIEDMQLRGLSERTQEIYVHAVKQLAAHYQKPPDEVSEQELRQYFLYLKNVKGLASSTRAVTIRGHPAGQRHGSPSPGTSTCWQSPSRRRTRARCR